MGLDFIKWHVRIAMGNANMVCYAVEDALKHHKFTANFLAFHAEYVQQRDIDEAYAGATTLNQLKWDSCCIWSIGPIKTITLQGPAKDCLAAAVWPQRDDGRGSAMGYLQTSYKRVKPTHMMLGLEGWPDLNNEVWEQCV